MENNLMISPTKQQISFDFVGIEKISLLHWKYSSQIFPLASIFLVYAHNHFQRWAMNTKKFVYSHDNCKIWAVEVD